MRYEGRGVVRYVIAFLVVCVAAVGCKDSGSTTGASKSNFRLSLSKREVPVVRKVAN